PTGVQLLGKGGEALGRYAPFIGCAVCLLIAHLLSLRLLRGASIAAETPSGELLQEEEKEIILSAGPGFDKGIPGAAASAVSLTETEGPVNSGL
ncbi:MAG: hypothetical protein C4320_00810, partial [Armatimonadota bacterium]